MVCAFLNRAQKMQKILFHRQLLFRTTSSVSARNKTILAVFLAENEHRNWLNIIYPFLGAVRNSCVVLYKRWLTLVNLCLTATQLSTYIP